MLSKRLKELREEKGITQAELAEKLKISRGSIGNYEKQERSPDADVILNMADFFGVSTDYLLGKTEFRSFNQQYELFRKKIDLDSRSTLLSPLINSIIDDGHEIPISLRELNKLMVSIDKDYTSIMIDILTGNEKYRLFTLKALNQFLKLVSQIGKNLKSNSYYDDDMDNFLIFLKTLMDTNLSPSDLRHIQANQTHINACTKYFNEFISFFIYSVIDFEKIKTATEV